MCSEADFYAYHRYNVNAIEILIFECIEIRILFFWMHRNYETSSRNYTLQTDLVMFSSTCYLLDFVLDFKYGLE
jgi:hypothetical protein